MKNLFRLAIIVLLVFPHVSLGSDLTVRPFLIDRAGEPRDEFNEIVRITNDSQTRKYVVFATVNEISVDMSGEIKEFVSPVMDDRTTAITSWIEVTRGRIEIPPGESREVPLILNINPKAVPGEYHAFVGFVSAPNRPAAEAVAQVGQADGVVVKVTIADERDENMKIGSFLIDRFVTDATKEHVRVEIENQGDISSAPRGEIIFYDSKGVEVTSVPFNDAAIEVPPGQTVMIDTPLPAIENAGRLKANLSLRYGSDQRASLYDTTSFYMIPLPILVAILFTIVFVSLVVTYLFKRAFVDDEFPDDADEVTMYVRDGHEPNPKDHDINLKDSR